LNFSKADLREADLREANIIGADHSGAKLSKGKLSRARLNWTIFSRADLRRANLLGAKLSGAHFSEANLLGAKLSQADLREANIRGADLSGADLSGAKLRQTNLSQANLSRAILTGADLSGAIVNKANLSLSIIGYTKIINIDLSNVLGLKNTKHIGPSTIDIDTIFRSAGKIPRKFLEDAGVPDIFIKRMASLTKQAFQYYSCFISHSTKDKKFANRIYADLRNKGVRCWFAPEHMKIGDRILNSIDRSIRIMDKLLLILSEKSIGSEWVEDEVTTAFEEELKRKKTVLFPIRLDNSVMHTDEAWAAKLRYRHIGDFTNWKNHDEYSATFKRLLRDLQTKE
jgi:uncharacterized protein YjbI with pentapeptide repeats